MPAPSPTDHRPSVAVVVVTHNSAEVIGGCLDSLPDGLDGIERCTVTVVDNMSSDGTPELVSAHPVGATVVQTGSNAGYAAAINAGIDAAAGCDTVLILNPDVRLARGCALALLEALERPGVGIAVPPLLEPDGSLAHSLRREPSLGRVAAESLLGAERVSHWGTLGEIVGDEGEYRSEGPVAWATGALMAVSAQCLEDVGRWDESFFLYSEETDFCLRAADAGYLTWFTTEGASLHIGGESKQSPYLWSLVQANRVAAYRKRHDAVSSLAFRLVLLLGELLRSVGGSRRHLAAVRALAWRRPEVPSRAGGVHPWVCFSAQDFWYHNRAHSDIQLMRRVARDRPVLFVNSIGMRMPMPGRSTQVTRRILRKVGSVARFLRRPLPEAPSFNVMTPVILPFYGSPSMRVLNAWLVRTQVRLAARWLGIDLDDSVVMVTIPTALDVVEKMGRSRLLLNRSDLHSAFEETDQEMIRGLESELLRTSDVVLYTSHTLMEAESELAGDRAVFLDHGVDLDRFDPGSLGAPVGLEDVEGPVVGFFGGIDDYLVDVGLLEEVARSVPDATLVLIGDATAPIDELTSMANVRWLGFRPYEEIPSLGARFDVALMPWLRNEWMQYANPIKLKEYLALGLPVVSTDFPEVRFYEDVVAVAEDHFGFVELVREALAGTPVSTPAKRRARVAGSSWDARAAQLVALGEEQTD